MFQFCSVLGKSKQELTNGGLSPEFLEKTEQSIFRQILTNLGPPDWNPKKQSSGEILDKFGVRGVFECCKGKKGSQLSGFMFIGFLFSQISTSVGWATPSIWWIWKFFSPSDYSNSRSWNLDWQTRQSPMASVQRTRTTLADHSAGTTLIFHSLLFWFSLVAKEITWFFECFSAASSVFLRF